jgi:hypothetical protein
MELLNEEMWMESIFPLVGDGEFGFELSNRICHVAAHVGSLAMLKWAHGMGYPCDEETFSSAAQKGRLEIMKWICRNGCPWDEETCKEAYKGQHFTVLFWALENGCPCDEDIRRRAISGDIRRTSYEFAWTFADRHPLLPLRTHL